MDNGRDRRTIALEDESGNILLYEFEGIIHASESADLRDVLTVAVEPTMRRGEIMGIQRVHVGIRLRTAQLHSGKPKNGEGRFVALSPRALEVFQRRIGNMGEAQGRIFDFRADSVTHAFSRASDRARTVYEQQCEQRGIMSDSRIYRNIRFHDIRYEATSRRIERSTTAVHK